MAKDRHTARNNKHPGGSPFGLKQAYSTKKATGAKGGFGRKKKGK